MMQGVFRGLVALFLLLLAGGALAQSCEAFGEQVLELEGFGLARFGALSYSSQTDAAQLSGGVCIVSEAEADGTPVWRIVAASMDVVGVQENPRFSLSEATLDLPEWMLFAETLASSNGGFVLEGLSFHNHNVEGRAAEGRYNLETGRIALQNVTARGERFRVSGQEAALDGERLLFRDALITTCVCEGGSLYVVAAPSASVDLLQEEVLIQDGVLKIGSVEIGLHDEVLLSEAALSDLRFPVQLVETPESGLMLRTVPLSLAQGVGLELGLAALDSTSPRGVLLFHVDRSGVSATVGAAALGFQADLRRTEPLADWLNFTFGIRNRHWDEADYLHEGYLSLGAAGHLPEVLTKDQLDLSAGLTTAASSQVVGDRHVLSSRLNLHTAATYTLPDTGLGTLGLGLSGSLSYYPRYEQTQYGLSFAPRWQKSLGPVSASLRYERLYTNSASPFSTKLDRLTPRSLLSAGVAVSGALADGVEGKIGGEFRYDFLADDVIESATRTAKLSASADFSVGQGSLRPSLELELAQLLSPADDPDVKAYLAAELAYRSAALEAGVYAKYDLEPETTGLDALELYAAAPLTVEALTLYPFLAVDFAGVLSGEAPLELAGHGLELSYRSCCGAFTVGYRLHRDTFSTTLSFELPASDE